MFSKTKCYSTFGSNHHLQRENLVLFAAACNDNLLGGAARVAAELFNLLDNVHTLDNAAEDAVLAIEPTSGGSAEEELGAVAVLIGQ